MAPFFVFAIALLTVRSADCQTRRPGPHLPVHLRERSPADSHLGPHHPEGHPAQSIPDAANLGRFPAASAQSIPNAARQPAANLETAAAPPPEEKGGYDVTITPVTLVPADAAAENIVDTADEPSDDEPSDSAAVAFFTDVMNQDEQKNGADFKPEDGGAVGELRIKDPRRIGLTPKKPPKAVCRTRYLYHPEEADWEGAKAICEIEGGQLAIVTSEREQGRISGRFGKLREFWIGATDIEREGQFRWVNGQGLGFARWYRSQPNKKYPNTEHCVTFNYWGKDTKWGDRNCYDSRPFLCETMVCKPVMDRFPGGYPGGFKGPLRRPYVFPRNQNYPGPRGMGGVATRQWPKGRGFVYNDWERIRTPIHN